jgi:hypothetical protein
MKIFFRLCMTVFTISFLLGISWAQTRSSGPSSSNLHTSEAERSENLDVLLDQLAKEPGLGLVYIDDGSGEGTLVGPSQNAIVHKIVGSGSEIIPVLIKHLDDRRPTSALYKGDRYWNDPVRVSLGFVALDILTQITRDNTSLFVNGQKHCEYDGMGACIRVQYYSKPPTFLNLDPESRKRVQRLKTNWKSAYKRGLVNFEPPKLP